MMGEKISPCLAAVSPPRSWSMVREQAVWLDNHHPPSGPIACREGRGPRKWIRTGELTARPAPGHPHKSPRDKSKVQQRPRQWPNIRACSQPVSPPWPRPPVIQPKGHRSRWSEARRLRALSMYQSAGRCPPRRWGTAATCSTQAVQLRLIIAGAIICGPSRPPQRQCHSHCNKTVRLFRVASMSKPSNSATGIGAQCFQLPPQCCVK